MEFSLREWLILIGVIIIVVILVDGFRRYKKSQKFDEADDDDYVDQEMLLKEAMLRRELPNGGARASSDPVKNAFQNAKQTVNAPLTDLPHKVDAGPEIDKADDLQFDELASLVPERMNSEADSQKDYSDIPDEAESFAQESDYSEDSFERQYSNVDVSQVTPHGTADALEDDEFDAEIEEVIVINVFAAEDKPFIGMELLQLVLNCGMRYGDMDIFHRHEDGFDQGKVQFSMANAVEPGTFNLDTMGDNTSPGVSFFMGLPGPKNSMRAFDFMLETAQTLVRNLDGELRDERRTIMSEQSIEHCRQRIRDFERRRLMRVKSN
jgi:cell division protein ZipA